MSTSPSPRSPRAPSPPLKYKVTITPQGGVTVRNNPHYQGEEQAVTASEPEGEGDDSPSPPKPVPALHGSLKLPYARNPRGADSFITETPGTYLNQVFGIETKTVRSDSRSSSISSTRSNIGSSSESSRSQHVIISSTQNKVNINMSAKPESQSQYQRSTEIIEQAQNYAPGFAAEDFLRDEEEKKRKGKKVVVLEDEDQVKGRMRSRIRSSADETGHGEHEIDEGLGEVKRVDDMRERESCFPLGRKRDVFASQPIPSMMTVDHSTYASVAGMGRDEDKTPTRPNMAYTPRSQQLGSPTHSTPPDLLSMALNPNTKIEDIMQTRPKGFEDPVLAALVLQVKVLSSINQSLALKQAQPVVGGTPIIAKPVIDGYGPATPPPPSPISAERRAAAAKQGKSISPMRPMLLRSVSDDNKSQVSPLQLPGSKLRAGSPHVRLGQQMKARNSALDENIIGSQQGMEAGSQGHAHAHALLKPPETSPKPKMRFSPGRARWITVSTKQEAQEFGRQRKENGLSDIVERDPSPPPSASRQSFAATGDSSEDITPVKRSTGQAVLAGSPPTSPDNTPIKKNSASQSILPLSPNASKFRNKPFTSPKANNHNNSPRNGQNKLGLGKPRTPRKINQLAPDQVLVHAEKKSPEYWRDLSKDMKMRSVQVSPRGVRKAISPTDRSLFRALHFSGVDQTQNKRMLSSSSVMSNQSHITSSSLASIASNAPSTSRFSINSYKPQVGDLEDLLHKSGQGLLPPKIRAQTQISTQSQSQGRVVSDPTSHSTITEPRVVSSGFSQFLNRSRIVSDPLPQSQSGASLGDDMKRSKKKKAKKEVATKVDPVVYNWDMLKSKFEEGDFPKTYKELKSTLDQKSKALEVEHFKIITPDLVPSNFDSASEDEYGTTFSPETSSIVLLESPDRKPGVDGKKGRKKKARVRLPYSEEVGGVEVEIRGQGQDQEEGVGLGIGNFSAGTGIGSEATPSGKNIAGINSKVSPSDSSGSSINSGKGAYHLPRFLRTGEGHEDEDQAQTQARQDTPNTLGNKSVVNLIDLRSPLGTPAGADRRIVGGSY